MKQDKLNLRARELKLYKVIQKFSKDGEPWALIQKNNTQFRRKQYEVKIAELILLQTKETLSDEEVTGKDLEDIDCNKTRNTTTIDKSNRPRRRAAEAARKKK